MERLDKFLSAGGAGTRSQVKELLKAGRVSVDGLPERDPGRKIVIICSRPSEVATVTSS